MSSTWVDKKAVVAIDFGTTFSGYAYSLSGDYRADEKTEKIHTPYWPTGSGPSMSKTPTVLLLSPDKGFVAFGYDAESRFAELADDEDIDESKYHYFKHFKMELYSDQKCKSNNFLGEIKDQKGRKFRAVDVFAKSIEYMKKRAYETIHNTSAVGEQDVYFVLTCPAIWSDWSKQFMREAAEKAGISHDHLRIALEPECAAVYMHTNKLPTLSASSRELFPMADGDCYFILDMGGGTVDIAVHKINRQGKFEEIMHPNGGPWGGININLRFEQALVAVSGAPTFERFRKECTNEYLDLMRDFEIKKLAFPSESSNVVYMKIPRAYIDCHTEENSEDFKMSLRGLAPTAILAGSTFKNGKLKITNERFEMLFQDTFKHIIGNVGLLLERLRQKYNVKTIFCVGGFSDCKLLSKKIKDTFPNKTVIIPSEAVVAIMKGAIIYGRDESIIQSRISKFTYGLDWNEDFDPNKHPVSKKETTEDGEMCKDIFLTIAKKGDSVPTDIPTKCLKSYVKTSIQTAMEFPFYRTDTITPPRFIDEPGCVLVGSMLVPIPDIEKGLDRCVKLEIYFGATEFRAIAKVNGGATHEVTFNLEETQV
ncbi:heat shock 70 kDa protein 12B-like [Mya arenaria]|uniref:heat shock 70 kDa protein 12B-like n=1 Tax=Mya arenaria TaxID=6604 RepID=UPI0022E0E7F5|nr:heat shock 70 kDa protein 12B-like [Mya arenaria]